MYSKFSLIATLALGLIFSACNNDKKDGEPKSSVTAMAHYNWSAKNEMAAAQIRVVNQFNEAVVGAQILIGNSQGSPFQNNFITTDKNGNATVSTAWTTPAAITVEASGYIRQTILNQKPGNITLKLNTAYLANRAEVRGVVTDLPVVNGDKLIDFALMMPALSKAALLNFDLNDVISPYSDTLSAAGQKSDVPSNLSLPKQKENYSIIGVTLEKPVYRLKVATYGNKKFVSVRGRFEFKKVVSELRDGKPFFDLINYFSILGGTLRETAVVGDQTTLDLPGNALDFSSTIQANAVPIQSDEVLMLIAASEVSGAMIPTDIKRSVNGQPTNLQSLPNSSAYVVSVIKKQADLSSTAPGADRVSASLLPYAASKGQQVLLPIVGNPSVTNSGNYVINLPNLPSVNGINGIATTASISDLIEVKDGSKTILTTNKKWEIMGPGWTQQLNLPKWPLDGGSTRKRVEINLIGSTTSKSTDLNDNALLDNATHVTHASTDL